MGDKHGGARWGLWPTLSLVAAISGCNPSSSLQNQEYLGYLDGYERRDHAVVVAAFNQLDSKRASFDCEEELEAAQWAAWREKAGRVDADETGDARAFEECLRRFFDASGVRQGLNETKVVPQWVSHNFLPDIRSRIDGEVQAAQKRIGGAGCGGDACESLTVVGDVAVPRAGHEAPAGWAEARDRCLSGDVGGLSPWRLPTRGELEAMRKSGRLASDQGLSLYWSGERELTPQGTVKAWAVDLSRPSGDEEAAPPTSFPLDGRGRPKRLKVRCVHDLTPAKAPAGEVDTMELALEAIRCPTSDWEPHLRLRKGLLVSWQTHARPDRTMEEACGEIDWCGLSWTPPSKGQAEALAADPWFAEGAAERCVATPPRP